MEHWRPIFNGYYEVSILGDVRRVAGGSGAEPGKVLRHQDKDGYRAVSLSVQGQPRRYYVHRLVAIAFLGPCPPGHVVNHKDGDRANCALSNLEYVTAQQNSLAAGRNGQLREGENHAHAKATVEQVREMRAKYARGIRQAILCREYGLVPSTVHHIVHGITWKSVK